MVTMGESLVAALPMILLGAVLGLDVVSFPQAMISRPIVGTTLAGALAGAPWHGLLCGAILECIALETLPVGASRYPEWGSASVIAGATAARLNDHPGALVLATIAGLVFGWVGGESMIWHRKLIGAWAKPRIPALAAGSFRTVLALQLFGMTADVARAALLTAIGLASTTLLGGVVAGRWGESGALTDAMVVGIAGAVAAFAAWKLFHGFEWARWAVAAGFLVGIAVVGLS
jgi:mannose/fructose/N-acetylgalactosamine-specific phosphotransferase system component IIC